MYQKECVYMRTQGIEQTFRSIILQFLFWVESLLCINIGSTIFDVPFYNIV